MALYPEVQRAAHAEIDAVLGDSRLPDFSDEDELPYVNAVLKEVLRWHPVAPLGESNIVTSNRIWSLYQHVHQAYPTVSRKVIRTRAT